MRVDVHHGEMPSVAEFLVDPAARPVGIRHTGSFFAVLAAHREWKGSQAPCGDPVAALETDAVGVFVEPSQSDVDLVQRSLTAFDGFTRELLCCVQTGCESSTVTSCGARRAGPREAPAMSPLRQPPTDPRLRRRCHRTARPRWSEAIPEPSPLRSRSARTVGVGMTCASCHVGREESGLRASFQSETLVLNLKGVAQRRGIRWFRFPLAVG